MSPNLRIVGRVPWKSVITGLGVVAAIFGIWQFIVDPIFVERKNRIFLRKWRKGL